jgi:hypothetical protein
MKKLRAIFSSSVFVLSLFLFKVECDSSPEADASQVQFYLPPTVLLPQQSTGKICTVETA